MNLMFIRKVRQTEQFKESEQKSGKLNNFRKSKISPWMLKKANFCLPLFQTHYFFFFFLACVYFYKNGSFFGHSLLLSQFFLLASLFHFHVFVFMTCINQSPHYSADWACLIGADIIYTSSQPSSSFTLVSKAVFFNTHPPLSPSIGMCVKFPGCLSLSPRQLLDDSPSQITEV